MPQDSTTTFGRSHKALAIWGFVATVAFLAALFVLQPEDRLLGIALAVTAYALNTVALIALLAVLKRGRAGLRLVLWLVGACIAAVFNISALVTVLVLLDLAPIIANFTPFYLILDVLFASAIAQILYFSAELITHWRDKRRGLNPAPVAATLAIFVANTVVVIGTAVAIIAISVTAFSNVLFI